MMPIRTRKKPVVVERLVEGMSPTNGALALDFLKSKRASGAKSGTLNNLASPLVLLDRFLHGTPLLVHAL